VKKNIFVKDIKKEHMDINDLFIVTKKGVFSTKNNTKYMSIGLRDTSGVIEGKIWERVDELQDLFDKNDLVYVKSKSRFYQEKPQLNISDIRKVDEVLTLDEMKEAVSLKSTLPILPPLGCTMFIWADSSNTPLLLLKWRKKP
jgi:3'-5' exoribonuclease